MGLRLILWLLFPIMVLTSCQADVTPPAATHSHIYLRTQATHGKRSPQWEFTDCGGGRYVLYDKDVKYDFVVDVQLASGRRHLIWGGNSHDADIVPGVQYHLENRWGHNVQCGYRMQHCDSIVLFIDEIADTACITFHTSRPPEPLVRLNMPEHPKRATATAVLPQHDNPSVLALGNSITMYNHQDWVFTRVAASVGVKAEWAGHCHGNFTLDDLWNEGQFGCSKYYVGARTMVMSRPWSHIVLQDYSIRPLSDPHGFAASVHRWVDFIRNHTMNRDAHIMLLVNYPWKEMWNQDDEAYRVIAHNCQSVARSEGIELAPVGVAYYNMFVTSGCDALWRLYADSKHPSVAGTYLAACIYFSLMTGRSLDHVWWYPVGIDAEEAKLMRQLATKVL